MRPSPRLVQVAFLSLVTMAFPAVVLAAADYSIADGAAELSVSIASGESMIWMNTFPVDPGGGSIDTLKVAYGRVGGGSALNNLPVRILLYEDADGGSPENAVLKWSLATVIANANTNVLNAYRLPATLVQGNLVVAALYENTTFVSKGIGALDTTAPSFANRSYVGFTGTIDPTDLSTFPPGQFGTMESFGTTGNFRIEAHGRTVDESAVALSVGSDPSQQSVALSWAGSQLTFDVERASRPDFADGQVLATGVPGTVFDDPVLADGHTWYYRIR